MLWPYDPDGPLARRLRGLSIPLMASPLVPAAFVALLNGEEGQLAGALGGMGLAWLAMTRLRRASLGDTRLASWLMGGATGVVALFAAEWSAPIAVLLGLGAVAGTRLAYEGVTETAPPVPPPEPPAPVAEAAARLGRLRATALRLPHPPLATAIAAIGRVLDEVAARPERLPQARRFLTVHLDGLERIAGRLEAGAAPPATLPPLLADLSRTADELRERLRREESDALEVQVKVLSDRLRQEGY